MSTKDKDPPALGRDAPDPVPLNAVRAAIEAVDTGRTQIARDNLRILEIHLRAQSAPPPASVPDGWLPIGVAPHPERNTRVVYWHKSDNGGFSAIADEWRDEHHLAFASHWLPSASTKPANQEGAAP